MWMRLVFSMSVILVLPLPAFAAPPRLALPIDCEIGPDCFVQQYVDQNAGVGYRDYRCGPLTYNGHKGTDFRLRSHASLADEIAVVAAAPGTVKRVRDGVPDVDARLVGRDAVLDVGLGNTVIIDHGGGWRTIYAHMKRGSIAVQPKQTVQMGQKLGLVGLSGLTEFPHVHFQVQFGNRVIDPFVGLVTHTGCEVGKNALWRPEVLTQLTYQPTRLLQSGFSTRPMKRAALQYGLHGRNVLSRKRGNLYFGVFVAGLYPGDKFVMQIFDSQGKRIRAGSSTMKKSAAVQFRSLAHEQATPLPAGQYRARFTLLRTKEKKTERVIAIERRVILR